MQGRNEWHSKPALKTPPLQHNGLNPVKKGGVNPAEKIEGLKKRPKKSI